MLSGGGDAVQLAPVQSVPPARCRRAVQVEQARFCAGFMLGEGAPPGIQNFFAIWLSQAVFMYVSWPVWVLCHCRPLWRVGSTAK